jgi:hypothetical protein
MLIASMSASLQFDGGGDSVEGVGDRCNQRAAANLVALQSPMVHGRSNAIRRAPSIAKRYVCRRTGSADEDQALRFRLAWLARHLETQTTAAAECMRRHQTNLSRIATCWYFCWYTTDQHLLKIRNFLKNILLYGRCRAHQYLQGFLTPLPSWLFPQPTLSLA